MARKKGKGRYYRIDKRERKATRHGRDRSYEAFLRLPEAERVAACEMDTVEGRKRDS